MHFVEIELVLGKNFFHGLLILKFGTRLETTLCGSVCLS